MKTTIVIIAFMLFSFKGFSQAYVMGGVNLANISTSKSGGVEKNNMLTTFNAGILSRFNISNLVDLESGVIFEGRGAKAATYFTSATDDNYVKAKFNPLYIEVPLNVVVRLPLAGTSNIFINAGPYAAIGIGGKSKVETKIFGATTTSENAIKFSNDDPFTSQQDDAAYDKIKRFDFGLNFAAGIDLEKILLRVNYGLGLTKINSTQSNNGADDKNKYRTISLSVGIPLVAR